MLVHSDAIKVFACSFENRLLHVHTLMRSPNTTRAFPLVWGRFCSFRGRALRSVVAVYSAPLAFSPCGYRYVGAGRRLRGPRGIVTPLPAAARAGRTILGGGSDALLMRGCYIFNRYMALICACLHSHYITSSNLMPSHVHLSAYARYLRRANLHEDRRASCKMEADRGYRPCWVIWVRVY